ncbi:MAG: hypothetical protein ABIA78_02910 [archaeon]
MDEQINKKRYWLRGGIAGGVVGIMLIPMLAFISENEIPLMIIGVIFYPFSLIVKTLGLSSYLLIFSPVIIGSAVYGFLIGLTYDIIKNKNQNVK